MANINEQEIFDYLDKFRNVFIVEMYKNKISNNKICISLNDRPEYIIHEGDIGKFFLEYQKRCSFLESIIGISTESEIRKMIDFINGETNDLEIYHYSIFPKKIENEKITLNKYYLVSLREKTFDKLFYSHKRLNFNNKLNSFKEHCSILISQENIQRANHRPSSHLFFDKLDDIYSNHSILEFIFDYYFGEIDRYPCSINTDNFPFANTPGSIKLRPSKLEWIDISNIGHIDTIINSLQNKLYYRLIIRSEINAMHEFPRAVFLRTLLDPFFQKNNSTIQSYVKSSNLNKTTVQAKYILKFLNIQNSNQVSTITESELETFLKIRNKIIHPKPNENIDTLHLLYDKLPLIRKVIYEFIFLALEYISNNQLNDFELNITL